MRSILKAFPTIGTALLLATMLPGLAVADDDDDDGGYHRRGHGSQHYGHRGHGHYGYSHHSYRHNGYHGRHYSSKHVYVVPKMVYVNPPPVYVNPKPVYKEDDRWRRLPPRPVTTWRGPGEQIDYNQPSAEGPASTCLMTREYQTQVAVGGKLVPGYGYACLQPDGSWYHGPAVPIERR